ncbi:MAG TPA: DUF1971 domain-containing protein [Allosphingosinicella sp.]|jgi:tellurite resistance-related uncharacterized protein|uniref:DUF1971 domain-containing protein n=1 Tax=Allosphingosinicella sp. TaxID=2823234 RepID=UPI002F2ACB09
MLKVDPEPARALPEPARRIPPEMSVYKRTPQFRSDTVPAALLRAHSTKADTWGRIRVVEGTLIYRVVDARRQRREWVLTPLDQGVVEPTILHEVELTGAVTFFVEFLREPILPE